MKCIESFQDLIGETIEDVSCDAAECFVKFKGDKFCIIEATNDYDYFSLKLMRLNNMSIYHLRDHGLINEDEFSKRKEDMYKKDEERRKEDRMIQYLQLKKEFEDNA